MTGIVHVLFWTGVVALLLVGVFFGLIILLALGLLFFVPIAVVAVLGGLLVLLFAGCLLVAAVFLGFLFGWSR